MEKIRRYDVDWIRVLVFDLLILYHVGMFFVPWGWVIKNNVISEWLVYPMYFVNQWRLPILFVVSGMGTRFALSNRTGKQYMKERFNRLFIPLIFSILIIVPPQIYIERLSQGLNYASYFEFYPDFFKGVHPEGNFSWHHLWFLPYLLFYSIIFTPLFLYLRRTANSAFFRFLKSSLTKYPITIYCVAIPLILIEYWLQPLFPITMGFIEDWYAHSLYSVFFLIGFFVISMDDVWWKVVERLKLVTLIIGILITSVLMWGYNYSFGGEVYSILRILNIWSWILTIFGYASRFLNKSSKILRYRNQAVYPFYILHQTITVIIGYNIMNSEMSIPLKFIILVIGTFGISWIIHECVIRRIRFIGKFFGLKY